MTKSELIDQLAEFQKHLAHLDVELGVKSIIEQMSSAFNFVGREEIQRPAKRLLYLENTFLISNRARPCASASIP